MNKNKILILYILSFILVSHLILKLSNLNKIFIICLTFSICFLLIRILLNSYIKKINKTLFNISICILTIQLSHVVLRKVNYPFSYVGMYSWVSTDRTTNHIHSRNLYDLKDNLITSNSGLIFSPIDDLESKLVTRLLKKNNRKLDSTIINWYKIYKIK